MAFRNAAEFAALLPTSGRLLGCDVGEKTIGLAISDAGRMIASPLLTLSRGKWSRDLAALQAEIKKHAICGMVIGYPLNMDGSEGPRCQSTRQFARNMEQAGDLPMLLWDERLSTMAVDRAMLEADLSRAKREEHVDKLAASYILQGFLDFHRKGI